MAFQSVPTHLGGITIWDPWSNKTDAKLEDSVCTVRVLLFFPIRYTVNGIPLAKKTFALSYHSHACKSRSELRAPLGLRVAPETFIR